MAPPPRTAAEVRELGPEETGLAHEAMLALGREVGTVTQFVERVNRELRPDGYKLAAALMPGEDQAVAAAGYRTGHDLVHGAYLFVDDLATRAAFRRQGHAGTIMDWLEAEARRLGCRALILESGVQRHEAHRFYVNRGMDITSHHFRLDLDRR
jgi:GNAT superfamily N-acetyltransferase